MWVHYAIRCDRCGAIGWGFDGSPIVYYNMGRLAHGNFKPEAEILLRRAGMSHVCQCGKQVIAQKIHFADYKILTKSAEQETAYETAVNNYNYPLPCETEPLRHAPETDRLLSEGPPLPFFERR